MEKELQIEKLTDEELSRVLTAHEENALNRGGCYYAKRRNNGGSGLGCLIQVAKADKNAPWHGDNLLPSAKWFDNNYQKNWSSDELLTYLENAGIA